MTKSKNKSAETEYVLGTDPEELVRLGLQHQLWAEYAARAWERAGFGLGHKLLDVGCGPGYATLDLASRAGTGGQVFGVDISPRFIHYLQAQITARRVTNVIAAVGNVERLNYRVRTFDGAYARWVLCFVKNPEAVVAGVARALKPGGVFVVQDYFQYESISVAPNSEIFRHVFAMVAQSWRIRGGNPDVGAAVPSLMARCGFSVKEINPIVRSARPGSPLWSWPKTFFKTYLDTLVGMNLLTEADKREFQREWKKRSRDPGAFFTSPPVIEVIGVKE